MYSVSFGKKIPVANCKVKELESGKYVPVKMYEYDCSEQADIDEVENLPSSFGFKKAFVIDMQSKKKAREKYSMEIPVSHYVMQTEAGEILGVACVKKDEDTYGVKLIQTSQNLTHKYIGQTMLASIAQIALNDDRKNFEIRYPTDEATSFYTRKCGFKPEKDSLHLEMQPNDMKKFIFKTQMKTHAPIVDIRV